MSAAIPISAPAAATRARAGRAASDCLPSAISPIRPTAAASTSRCPAATMSQSSSGVTVQSRWARRRRAGSQRSIRSATNATTPKAIAFHTFSQNTTCAAEMPPSLAARNCSIVASGPYTLTACSQVTGTDRAKALWARRRLYGVVRYGLWPSAMIRP